MKEAVQWMLAAILAAGAGFGATMSGSIRTAEGNEIASTITVAAAASAMDYSSHAIDLSNGVPRNVRFTRRKLGFFERTVADSRRPAVAGAKVLVRNLDHWRRIYIDRYSTGLSDADGNFPSRCRPACPTGSWQTWQRPVRLRRPVAS